LSTYSTSWAEDDGNRRAFTHSNNRDLLNPFATCARNFLLQGRPESSLHARVMHFPRTTATTMLSARFTDVGIGMYLATARPTIDVGDEPTRPSVERRSASSTPCNTPAPGRSCLRQTNFAADRGSLPRPVRRFAPTRGRDRPLRTRHQRVEHPCRASPLARRSSLTRPDGQRYRRRGPSRRSDKIRRWSSARQPAKNPQTRRRTPICGRWCGLFVQTLPPARKRAIPVADERCRCRENPAVAESGTSVRTKPGLVTTGVPCSECEGRRGSRSSGWLMLVRWREKR